MSAELPHDALPPEAWVAALAALDGMGPHRLRSLLAHHADPSTAWHAVRSGAVHRHPAVATTLGTDPAKVAAAWAAASTDLDPHRFWQRHAEAGIGVTVVGRGGFPAAFADDLDPPTILFHLGDPDVVVGPRVAVVGTRDCTRYGYDVAFALGRELAVAGVAIVSGLALGIDAAAHAGAIDADATPPIAVVGSGLDVVYPRRNGPLWREVARRGVVFSEYPLGVAPAAWHFPARNRLIAGLADVVVVVESHATGGALLTVDEALRRQRTVMAVPGPVHSPASRGTNDLLAEGDGAAVVRDAGDVLVALGLASSSRRPKAERRPPPAADDQVVLDAMGWQPVTTDHLVLRTSRSVPELAAALTRLERAGWVAPRGGWYERMAKPGG